MPNLQGLYSDSVFWVQVALNVPLLRLFDYKSTIPICVGMRVIVPFGKRILIGVVINQLDKPSIDQSLIRKIEMVLDDTPPFNSDWLRLVKFTAEYYHHSLGEVILSVIPNSLRNVSSYKGFNIDKGPIAKMHKRVLAKNKQACILKKFIEPPLLSEEQKKAVNIIESIKGFKTILLYGVTGSGKTEVYLRAIQNTLSSGSQVLVMVPEINLAPQLELSLRIRLEIMLGCKALAIMHSNLTETQRVETWFKVQNSQIKILLGTRMSIFAPFSKLGLIVVDEEHDMSYKQRDGLRYSARDLAIWRANNLNIPVILGSATPSLETWSHAENGKYLRLNLTNRVKFKKLPKVHLININREKFKNGLAPQLIHAIENRLNKKEQSLIFLNRRGYAPVLYCTFCSWISNCPRCSAFSVLHKQYQVNLSRLTCHYCGYETPVIKMCPKCGAQYLRPIGYGTQRIETNIRKLFPTAKTVRIDADTTRRKGSANILFNSVHSGEIDILIGTQMISKGHDFSKLSLIGILNTDSVLFTQDFRGSERLFAQLMQVTGRAGRHLNNSEVFVQTEYAEQSVYKFLKCHDYIGFAKSALCDRKIVNLPPYSYQALLTAESKNLVHAISFLKKAKSIIKDHSWFDSDLLNEITMHDPVPLRVMRIANIERAQLLVESKHRTILQKFLKNWMRSLPNITSNNKTRWKLDIDPVEI
ncbi:MAG: primosomal protein N' [Bordetella sp.]|nr:MAG: primosomal protein N' [Bordetella sp.]